MLQPRERDFLAAREAMTELAFFDPAERGVDGRALQLAPTLLGQGHRLHLHGIDPRKPADAVLVERDRLAIAFGQPILLGQCLAPCEQLLAKLLVIDGHDRF